MMSDLLGEWVTSRNTTLTTEIGRLRTTSIFQDLTLERGGNNEDYRNKFWGKFGCDAIRVVNTRRYGRLDESASTSSAGQRSSTPTSGQTKRQETPLYERIQHSTSFSRIIYSFGLDWTDHRTKADGREFVPQTFRHKQSDTHTSEWNRQIPLEYDQNLSVTTANIR
jgi:hypothetical protein